MNPAAQVPLPVVPRRGEVYWLDFSPATGAKMRELHPALVIQNDVGNRASALTIVAAITSNLRVADLPVGVRVEPAESGLPQPSAVHLGHVYTVDKRRLQRRAGELPPDTMARIDDAIRTSVGLQPFRLAHT
ncbi:MAG: type II toxin-antitoxin system PemK/MazF family toxin [Chloroflexi bacterium]|nr:type II toxin-antitoxin system PemK/MazF family toxin [Chloroflexota bacterium]